MDTTELIENLQTDVGSDIQTTRGIHRHAIGAAGSGIIGGV